MRQVDYEERNQSPRSLRRIKKLARQSGLGEELVRVLVSRSWNYDRENFCWVPQDQRFELPESAIATLEAGLRWPRDHRMDHDEIVALAMDFVKAGLAPHVDRFLGAVPIQSSWAMSPLVTAATLRGLTTSRVADCKVPEFLDFDLVCSHATAKLGAFLAERNDLAFTVVDAHTVDIAGPPPPNDGTWLTEVCAAISSLGPGSKLADLQRATAAALKGNKGSRQTVLEALGVLGVLGTDEFGPGVDFWPEKSRLSKHFYSNEWRFPMNFWAESGRVVGPQILLSEAAE